MIQLRLKDRRYIIVVMLLYALVTAVLSGQQRQDPTPQDTVAVEQASPDSVITVRRATKTAEDAFLIYVLPAVGTFLAGLAALILARIKQALDASARRTAAREKSDAEQRAIDVEERREASAVTIVAAANAKLAAERVEAIAQIMREDGLSRDEKLEKILELSEITHKLVNSRADRAEERMDRADRQIEQLSEQLRARGVVPKPGNGGTA